MFANTYLGWVGFIVVWFLPSTDLSSPEMYEAFVCTSIVCLKYFGIGWYTTQYVAIPTDENIISLGKSDQMDVINSSTPLGLVNSVGLVSKRSNF